MSASANSTLLAACQANDILSVVNTLTEKQPVKQLAHDEQGYRCLHVCARAGHARLVRLLCAFSHDPNNALNERGMTPLMLGSESGQVEVVLALLAHAALDVDVKCHRGHTALWYAEAGGHADICEALLGAMGAMVGKHHATFATKHTVQRVTCAHTMPAATTQYVCKWRAGAVRPASPSVDNSPVDYATDFWTGSDAQRMFVTTEYMDPSQKGVMEPSGGPNVLHMVRCGTRSPLARLADVSRECWESLQRQTYPDIRCMSILKRVVSYAFVRQLEQDHVLLESSRVPKWVVFNTGLQTHRFQPLLLLMRRKRPRSARTANRPRPGLHRVAGRVTTWNQRNGHIQFVQNGAQHELYVCYRNVCARASYAPELMVGMVVEFSITPNPKFPAKLWATDVTAPHAEPVAVVREPPFFAAAGSVLTGPQLDAATISGLEYMSREVRRPMFYFHRDPDLLWDPEAPIVHCWEHVVDHNWDRLVQMGIVHGRYSAAGDRKAVNKLELALKQSLQAARCNSRMIVPQFYYNAQRHSRRTNQSLWKCIKGSCNFWFR